MTGSGRSVILFLVWLQVFPAEEWASSGGELFRGGVVVLLAAEVAVVFEGGFEELVAAVVELFAVFGALVDLGVGEGWEVAEDC